MIRPRVETGVKEEMMHPTPPSAKLASQRMRALLPWPS